MKKALFVFMLVFAIVFSACGSPSNDVELNEGETLINHLIITLPEGFSLRETAGVKVACFENYPERPDNISFVTTQKDSPENYTKEKLDNLFSSLVAGFSGGTSLEVSGLSGCEVLIYSYNLVIDEKPLLGVQYMIFGSDFTDTITATIESEDGFVAVSQMIESARIA